ncbi:MAG: alpha/beta hydrolase [Bryobacteraceae bacterium]
MRLLPLALLLMALPAAAEPKTELLWPDGAPGAKGEEDRDKPSLTIYLADKAKATGTGIVVCPGGGYVNLAMDHEGKQIAEWLNNLGISAFVLKYRLGPRYRHPAQLNDAQRAIRIVRARAKEFGIASDRIGIWGFSAGGHLASTAATHFDPGKPDADSPIDRAGSRPDFAILAYPVISFIEFPHVGSRRNLLGENYDPKLAEFLSNDRQVTPETPPTFLFHTNEDSGVPPENSILFYLALRKAKVPAELHIYEKGRHGVGLAPDDPVLSSWADRLKDWLKIRGLLNPASSI